MGHVGTKFGLDQVSEYLKKKKKKNYKKKQRHH